MRSVRSKIKKIYTAMISCTLGFMLNACGPKSGPPVEIKPFDETAVDTIVAVDGSESGWQKSTKKSRDRSVILSREDMPKSQIEYLRQQYKQTDLVPLPVDSTYNVSLFRIKNVPDYETAAFIAPRLYAYSSAEHGRMAPERHDDGTVSLTFPVVMASGTKAKILSPNGMNTIELPSEVIAQKLDELRSFLSTSSGIKTIAVMPGCPKRVTVIVGGTEYNASAGDLAHGDYCQSDVPFSVTIRVPESRAKYILREALYANQVDIRAIFETRVAFKVASLNLSFSKSKVFEEIKLAAKGKIYWVDAEANAMVTRIIKDLALKSSIQGEYSAQLREIVDQAIKEFFKPFKEDPSSQPPVDCKNLGCVTLNYNSLTDKQTFEVNWYQSENTLTGQTYLTSAKLHPLLDHTISMGGANGRPALSNDNSAGFETGLTVLPGDLLEITPSYLNVEKRELTSESTVRSDNQVCVESKTVIIMRPRNNPDLWREEVRCIRHENRWVDTTTYINLAPTTARIDSPNGTVQQLFEGLKIKFTWSDATKGSASEEKSETAQSMVCSISQFQRIGDGKSLILRIDNTPACPVFARVGKANPMISIINAIQYPQNYRSGSLVKKWNGEVADTTKTETYFPKVEFAGTISIRGYEFGSGLLPGSLVKL
jgi:hypothetical protein